MARVAVGAAAGEVVVEVETVGTTAPEVRV